MACPLDSRFQPYNFELLFQDSVVSCISSELAINSYISRHHLTKQAQEDLLQLVQLHVPQDSSVPSSVFTLRKYSLLNPVSAKHILHYMCPQCYTVLPDKNCDVCPNDGCCLSLDQETLSYFFTISIAEQLKIILKSKIHFY